MRFVICSHDGDGYFGGPYEWIKRFGPTLKSMGHEVFFLFISDHSPKRSTNYQYLKSQGFHCEILRTHTLSQYHDNTEDRVRWFLKKTKAINPDVFIANSILYAMYAGRWIKQAGIPVIGVLHSDDPTHERLYEGSITKNKDFAFSGIVAVSSFLKTITEKNNPFEIPIETISCGVPVPEKKSVFNNTPFKLIYAGKITDFQKRITETVEVFCRAVKEIPSLEIDIYGSGAEENKIQSIIKEKAEGFPLRFHGKVDSSSIQEIFQTAQGFVLLSDFEGVPVALMEAMATGLVPICYDIKSGIPELVTDKETGLVVNDRGNAFIQAIKTLSTNAVLWKELSANAIHKIKGDYSIEVTTKKWIEFSEYLCKNERKTEIKVPLKILLPPVNDNMQDIDKRKPSLVQYLREQVSRFLNKALKR